MTIGVDAGCLSISDDRLKTGVYNAVYHLLKSLTKIDKKNQYHLYSQTPISREVIDKLGKNFLNKVVGPQKFWLTLSLSKQIILDKPDIFIGFNHALPLKYPQNSIVSA